MREDLKSPLRDVFEADVPMAFLNDTLRLIFSSYRRAAEECRSLAWEVAHDYIGDRRRCLIEDSWPAVALRHRGHAEYQPNRPRSAFHAEVRFGRVVLTASQVESPDKIIRRADFRHTLARPNQLKLWDDLPPPLPSDPLFAVMIHGAARNREPGFAHIVFPAPDCESYLARIDLFGLCFGAVSDLVEGAVPEEVVPDQAAPTLRAQTLRDA